MTLAPALRLMAFDPKAEHQRYHLASGEEVVGASTIVRETLPTSPALLNWYRKSGAEGTDPKAVKEAAGMVGTITHARIAAFLQGYAGLESGLIPPELFALSWPGFDRFMQHWNDSGYAVCVSEHQMVSEKLRCGGTLDIMADTREGLVLIDIKTTKRFFNDEPYESHRLQAAGYARIWREAAPRDAKGFPVERVEIWRCGTAVDDVLTVHPVKKLAAHVRAFETAVAHFHALRAIDAV